MPLDLKPQIKERLISGIVNIMSRVKVDKRLYINYDSLRLSEFYELENKLTDPTIRRNVNKWIGENYLYCFIIETITKKLRDKEEYDQSDGILLTTFEEFRDICEVAEQLINSFNTLPFQYLISFELPQNIGHQLQISIGNDLKLNETTKIIIPNHRYDEEYPLSSEIDKRNKDLFDSYWVLDNIGSREPKKWNQESTYLQFNIEGFYGVYRTTPAIIDVIENIKLLIGLLIVLGVITTEKKNFLSPRVKHLIIHNKIESKYKIWSTYKIPMSLSEILENLTIMDKPENNPANIKTCLTIMSNIFSNCIAYKQVILASKWFLDSFVGDNEILSFVQAMISLEVCLIEKEYKEISLNKLISNRCAYLIGDSHAARVTLIKEIEAIYDVRSKIVHQGKSILNANERYMFLKLQDICKRVILKEIQLILKSQTP